MVAEHVKYLRVTNVSFLVIGKGIQISRKIISDIYAISEYDSEGCISVIFQCVVEYGQILMCLVHMGVSSDIENITLISLQTSSIKV